MIISIGICNKNGQLILSRQYDNLNKSTIQDIYLSFPKLIKFQQQHTYVQSDKYIFVYIPIQGLYLVLVSSKNSNIIQDQQTLKIMYKILMNICAQGIKQEMIQKYAVDIIMAMDDLISMGYRQSVTEQEVIDQLKMQSANQKAVLALLKQQQQQAKLANSKK